MAMSLLTHVCGIARIREMRNTVSAFVTFSVKESSIPDQAKGTGQTEQNGAVQKRPGQDILSAAWKGWKPQKPLPTTNRPTGYTEKIKDNP